MTAIGAHLKDYLRDVQKSLSAGNATEHTYRPALKAFIEACAKGVVATNEPRRVECGAPDYIVTRGRTPLGCIEAKDIGRHLDEVEKTAQMARYLEGLPNLILTDYLEFRLYQNGKPVLSARLARVDRQDKLRVEIGGEAEFAQLLEAFLSATMPTVGTPKDLAARMAALARLLCEAIERAFEHEEGSGGALHGQLEAFRKVLLHDLEPKPFADMYAQTICYGLFAARCNHDPVRGAFTRETAGFDLPETNPFLRQMFNHIAGPNLDPRLTWAVDQVADLLARADVAAILRDFGRRTRQEDPVVHFYETFLAAYDPRMREARGVYYTPEPVVSYIVRSVDHILKKDFGIAEGLASSEKVPLYKTHKTRTGGERREKTGETHRVLILDPAAGTGTFLHGVIGAIHSAIVERGGAGMWDGYVSEHLLPRLFGFELLMAPYAVCHMKLGIQLADTGYSFHSGERLRVYLTNTLEESFELGGLPLFASLIAEEANAAGWVKNEAPVMVILGNPPYSGHSANNSPWIADLLRGRERTTGRATGNYFEADGQPLGERNPKWLNDDYVKFIRFAQWRIEKTGYGVLAFISNHGYLDNPTFRGMRQSLMHTFDDIYILDLHGNTKKKETAPDGSKDENVFDIQQGVAIGIFVKRKSAGKEKPATVRHAELYGLREVWEESEDGERSLTGGKYKTLYETDTASTRWKKLQPQSPYYLFVPQNIELLQEYEKGWKVSDMMSVNSVGIVTARDELTIHLSKDEVWKTVKDFASLPVEEARNKYGLGKDVRDWKVHFAQNDLSESGPGKDKMVPVLYRPFDQRWTYYTGKSRGFICMPRPEVMRHMLAGENVGLITVRKAPPNSLFNYFLATRNPISNGAIRTDNQSIDCLFPLYLYPKGAEEAEDLFDTAEAGGGKRRANLSPEFIADFGKRLKLAFVPDGRGDLKKTFGPEDVFHYMYAVFHSPGYRARYAEFLKIDFPRLPLPGDRALFRSLCAFGERLKALHLMDAEADCGVAYPEPGPNEVDKVEFVEDGQGGAGRVYINRTQYFSGVPRRAWEFHVGGYQVCHKWLKDRKGRRLTYDDLTHYRRIVAALDETAETMAKIDDTIEKSGGWPLGQE